MVTTLEKFKAITGIVDKDDIVTLLIPMIEEDYQAIQNKPFTVENEVTQYPIGAELTAIEMIKYKLSTIANTKHDGSLKAFSLSRLSITYNNSSADMINGYPKSVVGNIKRYVKFI